MKGAGRCEIRGARFEGQGHRVSSNHRLSAFGPLHLEPGDLIATGAPAGVGPLNLSDRVEVTIEAVGTVGNRVVGLDHGAIDSLSHCNDSMIQLF
jgi:hypothetical protein